MNTLPMSLFPRAARMLLASLAFASAAFAQAPGPIIVTVPPEVLWPAVDPDVVIVDPSPPRAFALRDLDIGELTAALADAPLEGSGEAPIAIGLPLPGGGFEIVAVVESPVLADGFVLFEVDDGAPSAIPVPEVARTYVFRGVDDPSVSGRLVAGASGVQAVLRTRDGLARISPTETSAGVRYASFLSSDRTDGADDFLHSEGEQIDPNLPPPAILPRGLAAAPALGVGVSLAQTGATLRTFRLAVATTGEYTQMRGGPDPGQVIANVLDSVVAEMSAVNMRLEAEVAVRLALTSLVIYLDPATDPYDPTLLPNNPPACVTRDQNVALDGVVGAASYDVGFAFGAGPPNNIGCAWYVACLADKYRGAALIDMSNPPGNATGVLLHEMGHQLQARHTFSGSACPPIEYNAQAAYEPGSGTTIMSYAGACNEDRDGDGVLDPTDEDLNNNNMLDVGEDLDGDGNLDVAEDRNGNNMLDNDNVDRSQVGSGQYYHAISFEEIVAATTLLVDFNVCGTETPTANMPPIVSAGANYTIPRATPFTLTGSAVDPDPGDVLTFVWEQLDQGNPARLIDSAARIDGPIFRSVPPVISPDDPFFSRTFPRLPDILSGTQRRGEILPAVDRSMTFRLTARDNRLAGGGVASDEMTVTVAGSPFFVTSPNGGEVIGAGCAEPVTWTVGGGAIAMDVDLRYSDDGGTSFGPLVDATPNDGIEQATFSCAATGQGRVQASAVGNIFFDISDADFSIVPEAPVATITEANGGEVDEACSFTVTFAATVTDDCGVMANDVAVDVQKIAGLASFGPVTVNAVQNGPISVDVSGSFPVTDVGLDASMDPATFRIEVTGADACGLQGSDSAEVVVVDTIPPTISASLEPDVLWPPNHKLREIVATVEVMDNCPNPTFALTSATSDEPDNGKADGNTVNDIQGADIDTPDVAFSLRAERAGNMDGRTYTIGYTATDASKNTAEASDTVSVPHSR